MTKITNAWSVCVCATVISTAVLLASHTSLLPGPFAAVTALVVLLIGLHVLYRHRHAPAISDLSGGLAVFTWSGMAAGVTALAGLRLDARLIDDWLTRADHAIGVNTMVFVDWTAQHPAIGGVLAFAYSSILPLLVGCIVMFALTRHTDRMWEICASFAALANLSAAISTCVPAMGAMVHAHLPAALRAQLPAGAGVFYVATVEALRSGALTAIDVRKLEGVVVFPSFHAAMALIAAHAVRGTRARHVIRAWCGLIILSAIPIGGHYATDLIAGSALWAVWCLVLRVMPCSAPAPHRTAVPELPPHHRPVPVP